MSKNQNIQGKFTNIIKLTKQLIIGQYCPNLACDYIVKDFVELEEETESMNELEND